MTHSKESVRADALPPPQIESFRDLRRASTVVADDDGGDSLHQITHVAVPFGTREIPARMRVRIDKTGTNGQPADIQDALGGDFLLGRVPEKRNAVAANADVLRASRRAAPVNNLSACEQQVQ